MKNKKLVQNLQTCLGKKIELITYVRVKFNSVCVLYIHLLTLGYFTLYTKQIIVFFLYKLIFVE